MGSQQQEHGSSHTEYMPMKRQERKACWEARDSYFACLDQKDILDPLESAADAAKACPKENEDFTRDCAASWVIYFKQKRVADFKKAQQLKKLEAEGAIPIAQVAEKPAWKFW